MSERNGLSPSPFPVDPTALGARVARRRTQLGWKQIELSRRGDFLRNEGGWTLTPFRGDASRTRVEYRLFVAIDTALPTASYELLSSW